jgi:membrane protein required for colicin V production
MQTIDIIISVLLVIGLISGLRDGLVKQVAGLAGLIGGLLLGRAFYMPVGEWLGTTFGISADAAHITAFILILIVVPLLFSLVGWLVSKILSAICLGWINRILGGLVGVLKFALFAGIVITGIEFFDKHDTLVSEKKKEASALYYPIYDATSIFFNGVKEELGEQIGSLHQI